MATKQLYASKYMTQTHLFPECPECIKLILKVSPVNLVVFGYLLYYVIVIDVEHDFILTLHEHERLQIVL